MSALWAISLLAGASAVGFGSCLASYVYAKLLRRSAAASALASSGRERMILRLQRGVRPLLPACGRMVSSVEAVSIAVDYACDMLRARSVRMTREALLSIMLSASVLMGILGAVITLSPAFGLAIGVGSLLGAVFFLKGRSEKRDERMREEVPDAIRSLAASFKSGHSLPQVLSSSAEDCGGHIGTLFDVASDRLSMGEGTVEALSVLERNRQIPELTFVAVALDIQHRSGGAIGPVLDAAIESVECELDLLRSLRVQTAQVKLSATIVTIMPFILIACFSMLSPNFLAPFFSSPLGLLVLAIALAMQVTGVMAVRRMLKVEM